MAVRGPASQDGYELVTGAAAPGRPAASLAITLAGGCLIGFTASIVLTACTPIPAGTTDWRSYWPGSSGCVRSHQERTSPSAASPTGNARPATRDTSTCQTRTEDHFAPAGSRRRHPRPARRHPGDSYGEHRDGVLHMNPPPSYRHELLSSMLHGLLRPLAAAAGLETVGTVGIGVKDDNRIPDLTLQRPQDAAPQWQQTASIPSRLRGKLIARGVRRRGRRCARGS